MLESSVFLTLAWLEAWRYAAWKLASAFTPLPWEQAPQPVLTLTLTPLHSPTAPAPELPPPLPHRPTRPLCCAALPPPHPIPPQGERALAVFREAQALGIAPQARTYTIALKACGPRPGKALRRDQLLAALGLYGEMTAAGVDPDVVTFATLIELCAAAREGRVALELQGELRGRGLKENVVRALFPCPNCVLLCTPRCAHP